MILTLIYLVCMIWIPITFQRTGIQYIVQGRKQGVFMVWLALSFRWMMLLNLLVYWFDGLQTVWTLFVLVGLTVNFYKERKYLLFDIKWTKQKV